MEAQKAKKKVYFGLCISTMSIMILAIGQFVVEAACRNRINLYLIKHFSEAEVNFLDLVSLNYRAKLYLDRAVLPNWLSVAVPAKEDRVSCAMARSLMWLDSVRNPPQKKEPACDPVVCGDVFSAFWGSNHSASEGKWNTALNYMQAMPADIPWIRYLRLARELAAAERWSESIAQYRLAQSLMGDRAAAVFSEFQRVTAKWMQHELRVDKKNWMCLYRLARCQWWLGDWISARRSYELLLPIVPQELIRQTLILAEAHDRIGQVAENAGELDLASRMYAQAWLEGHRTPDLYERLRGEFAADADSADIAWLEDGIKIWSPTNLLTNLGTWPNPGDWTFVGYEINQDDLEWGGPVEVTFYWRNDDCSRIPLGVGWMPIGDKWALTQDAVNLVPDGSCEWGFDSGFEPIYINPRPRAGISIQKTDGVVNNFIRLPGASAWHDAFWGTDVVVRYLPGDYYLQSGRLRGDRANLYLGVLFLGSEINDPWKFTAFETRPEDWYQVVGIIDLPVWAHGFRTVLSNWEGFDPGDFDDLLLTYLPKPE
jgi:hypothetical protein